MISAGSELVAMRGLGPQVAQVEGRAVQSGGEYPVDLDAVLGQLTGLRRVAGEQVDPVDSQGQEHLGGHLVATSVLDVTQCEVGLERVEALVLEQVGVELGVQPDAPTLLPQVEQIESPRRVRRLWCVPGSA